MHIYVGRVNDEIVCGAMAYEGDYSVGMYTVFTLPSFRRRGYGEAIAWAVVCAFPALAVTTEPSESSTGIYQRMGFKEVGKYRIWSDT